MLAKWSLMMEAIRGRPWWYEEWSVDTSLKVAPDKIVHRIEVGDIGIISLISTECSLNILIFSLQFMIHLNSASSAASAGFLPT